jgi:Transposase IS116/IS110/IS902 family
VARACVAALGAQLVALKVQILAFDRRIAAWHRSNETSKRLDAIPGVGPALATALVANIADPGAFRSGRDFSAWIGLVPKQNSSGGKDKLGSITKQGDRYLRSLFTTGALAVIEHCRMRGCDRDLIRGGHCGGRSPGRRPAGDSRLDVLPGLLVSRSSTGWHHSMSHGPRETAPGFWRAGERSIRHIATMVNGVTIEACTRSKYLVSTG